MKTTDFAGPNEFTINLKTINSLSSVLKKKRKKRKHPDSKQPYTGQTCTIIQANKSLGFRSLELDVCAEI